MVDINATIVRQLRQKTGVGMMDCKKALTEADGDFDKAIEILRKKGQKVSASRADRDTKEGSVFIKSNDDKITYLPEQNAYVPLAQHYTRPYKSTLVHGLTTYIKFEDGKF